MGSYRRPVDRSRPRLLTAGTDVAAVMVVNASREDASQMLLEADAGFLRDAGGVGIDSLEKMPDFFLDLNLDDPHLRTAPGDLSRLDLTLHFRLHLLAIP